MQAQRQMMAKKLINALQDGNCSKITAIEQALSISHCHPRFTGYQILKVAVLAIWFFYKDKPFPELRDELYPLVSMVLNLPITRIATEMRFYAANHGNTVPSNLIFNLFQEAMRIAAEAH